MRIRAAPGEHANAVEQVAHFDYAGSGPRISTATTSSLDRVIVAPSGSKATVQWGVARQVSMSLTEC